MCVLCGEPLAHVHWTDSSGVQGTTATALAGPDVEGPRRRARVRRVAAVNAVLASRGLRVRDWGGRTLVLGDGKGTSVVVRDLGELWPAAARILGHRIDPLDPDLLAALEP